MAIVGCGSANALIVWQQDFFIRVFTTDPDVAHYASIRLSHVLLVQFLASSYEISGAYMRGLGYSMTQTVLTIFGTCVLRLVWVYTVNAHYNNFEILLYIYPISWIITGISVLIAAWITQRKAFADYHKPVTV